MELVLGLDLGTTNFKASLFSEDGQCRGTGSVANTLSRGDGVHAELTAEGFWSHLQDCISRALMDAGAVRGDIRGLSYSSQTNTFLLLDEADQPLTPLILWSDTRAAQGDDDGTDYRRFAGREDLLDSTGMGLMDPTAAIAKILWLRENRRDIWRRTRRIMSISDYLTFALTGERLCDAGTAAMTGLWSTPEGTWWNEVFESLDLNVAWMPVGRPSGTVVGTLRADAAEKTSLPVDAVFTLGGHDHYMAALGAGIGSLSSFTESTGTVLALCSLLPSYLPKPRCTLGRGLSPGQPYYRLSFRSEGAVMLEDYRREYASEYTFGDLDRLAISEPPGSGGLWAMPRVRPFSHEESFVGATVPTAPGQYARSIMEALAATLKELIEDSVSGEDPERIIATGGGARSDPWLEIKANMLETTITAVENSEPACTGAAMLAAEGVGWSDGPQDLAKSWVRIRKEFTPNHRDVEFYRGWYGRYREVAHESLRTTGIDSL